MDDKNPNFAGYTDAISGWPKSNSPYATDAENREYCAGYARGKMKMAECGLPTRPDPTRAEMAMHMPVPDELSVWQATAIMGEAPPQWSSKEDIEVSQKCVAWWLECEARYRVMQADALRAALDRKEASR